MSILCIVDGMADETHTLLRLPRLHALAARGAWGSFDTCPLGFAPSTLPCVLTLLGLSPEDIPPKGRGWLEALGAGMAFPPDALLLRGSWVALDSRGRAMGPGAAPEGWTPPGGLLCRVLSPGKAILALPGWAHVLERLTTFPPHEHWGEPAEALAPRGCPPLTRLFRLCRTRERALIPWGESVPAALAPPLFLGGGAVVAASPLVLGMALALGLKPLLPRGATGGPDTDLGAKARAGLALSKRHPFVLLHLGGGDEAAHQRDAPGKEAFLGRVDGGLVPLLAQSGQPLLLCSDHGSSPRTGGHLEGPQPFALLNAPLRGELGLLPGHEAVPLLLGQRKEAPVWPNPS